MINSLFEKNILNIVLSNALSKDMMLKGSELYIEKDINLISKSSSVLVFNLDGKEIVISFIDNKINYRIDKKESLLNEEVLACLLEYKKLYYIHYEIGLRIDDIQINSYYNSIFISAINYEEYQYRFNFYFGLINHLYKEKMNDECIELMIKFFNLLSEKITYEKKYMDIEKLNLFKVIKGKTDVLFNDCEKVLNIIDENKVAPRVLGRMIYISVVNYPFILQNKQLMMLYQRIFNTFTAGQKSTQFYSDLQLQSKIIMWYNKELPNTFMKDNIKAYEVMYCYVNYLYENKEYKEICELFRDYKFYAINNTIMEKILNAYYICNEYNDALDIFKKIKNITLPVYIKLKNSLPLLFNDENMESIIEAISENSDIEEAKKILILENKEEYTILLEAKENFNLIDENFDKYLGKYDKQLIMIYQKEILDNVNNLKGYYNTIPEVIISKFEKIKKIKNGKYYISEVIRTILETLYVPYSSDLEKYHKELEV